MFAETLWSSMLKIGIIGESSQALELGEIISNHTTCSFAGIYMNDAGKARMVAAGQATPVFTSYEAFLSGCDAIIVQSYDIIDSEKIIDALKGSRHILLDKPMDWHDEELEYLFKLADEANSYLKFRETFLYNPVIRAAEPFVHGPVLIDYQIGISSESPADKLTQLITRAILQCLDVITHLNRGQVSKYNTVFSPDLFGFPGVIHGRIEFDNGCIANITCNGYAEQEKSVCYIYQENRHAILNFLNKRLVIKDLADEGKKAKSFNVPIKQVDMMVEEIHDFTGMILNNSYQLSSSDRYLQSFLLARRMIENLPIHELQS